MPPVTPSAMSMALHVLREDSLDLLDLLFGDFLHRDPRELPGPLGLRGAPAQQLLRALSGHGDELELVHTVSFRTNELTMPSMRPAITVRRALSASTIALRRSTQASSSSFTTT